MIWCLFGVPGFLVGICLMSYVVCLRSKARSLDTCLRRYDGKGRVKVKVKVKVKRKVTGYPTEVFWYGGILFRVDIF